MKLSEFQFKMKEKIGKIYFDEFTNLYFKLNNFDSDYFIFSQLMDNNYTPIIIKIRYNDTFRLSQLKELIREDEL